MLVIIGVCIGIIIGTLVKQYSIKNDLIGNLVIINDLDEECYIFLEIEKTDINKLRKQSIIKLNVIDKGYISHK